jgi:hypothetical protein
MAQEIEITINETDLGRADREFGLDKDDLKLFDAAGRASVDVFVDGELAKLVEGPHKSIIAKAPSPDGRKFFAVVTGNDGQILNVLQYEGTKNIPVEDPADDESTLKDIAAAIKKIAEAMPPLRNR